VLRGREERRAVERRTGRSLVAGYKNGFIHFKKKGVALKMKFKIRIFVNGVRNNNMHWTSRQVEDLKTGIRNKIPGNYEIDLVDYDESSEFYVLNTEAFPAVLLNRKMAIVPGQTSSHRWVDDIAIRTVRLVSCS
jgi:hypothetical protein